MPDASNATLPASVTIVVQGEPVAKGRPRATHNGAHIKIYTPSDTIRFERFVGLKARQQMAGKKPFDCPLSASLSLYLSIPASWPKYRKEAALHGDIRPIAGRHVADLDNYAKSALDACNGIVWLDDKQIVSLTVNKWYSDDPGLMLIVTELPVCLRLAEKYRMNSTVQKSG